MEQEVSLATARNPLREDEMYGNESTESIRIAFSELKDEISQARDDTDRLILIDQFYWKVDKFRPSGDNISGEGLDIVNCLFNWILPDTHGKIVCKLLHVIAMVLKKFQTILVTTPEILEILQAAFTIEEAMEDLLFIFISSDFCNVEFVQQVDWQKVVTESPVLVLALFRHVLVSGVELPPDFIMMMALSSLNLLGAIDEKEENEIVEDRVSRVLTILILILKSFPDCVRALVDEHGPLDAVLGNAYAIDNIEIKRLVLLIIGYLCGNRIPTSYTIDFLVEAAGTPNKAVAIWALTNMLLAYNDCDIPRDAALDIISKMSYEMNSEYKTVRIVTSAIPCIVKHVAAAEYGAILFETGLFDAIPTMFETGISEGGTILADVLLMLNAILQTAHTEGWSASCTPIVEMLMQEDIPECEERDILMETVERL